MPAWDNLISQVDATVIQHLGGEIAAQYVSANSVKTPIHVIFDEKYQPVVVAQGDGSAEISAAQPYAFARIVDLPGGRLPNTTVNGDRLEIKNKVWRIVDYQRAGEGSIRLYLHEVRA